MLFAKTAGINAQLIPFKGSAEIGQAVLAGTVEDHRPDLTCRQANAQKTPVLLEVVTPQALEDPHLENRWSLLSSAAKLYSAELHFVVPRWTDKGALDQALRRRLSRMELPVNRVWTV